MKAVNTLARAVATIDALRGRCNARTVDERDLIQAIREARREGWGIRAGGTVANCYGYPASRMRLAVVRMATGDYAYACDWSNAKRGSSCCPIVGGRQDGPQGWEAWLGDLAQRRSPARDWRVIRARDVRRILAQRRAETRRQALAMWPEIEHDVEVLVSDSLVAGNCERETARVATWFGGAAVMASQLRSTILRREPTLARYGRRAVEAALTRSLTAAVC
jgi:hypothetical protein